jgi:ribosomal protein S21
LNGDIVGAFRQLGSVLKQNNVMREFKQQKFYEKPSDKRGRLSRERHRKRFLVGVRRLVGLVKEQRKFQ